KDRTESRYARAWGLARSIGWPVHTLSSLSWMCARSIPPKIIPPKLPLPTGKASVHSEAGWSYQSFSVLLCAQLLSQLSNNNRQHSIYIRQSFITVNFPDKICFMYIVPDYSATVIPSNSCKSRCMIKSLQFDSRTFAIFIQKLLYATIIIAKHNTFIA